MDKLDINLEQQIDNFYYNEFYHENAAGEDITHVRHIMDLAKEIVKKNDLIVDPLALMLTIYTHDIFSTMDEENHNLLAKAYVERRGNRYLAMLNDETLQMVADAIGEHKNVQDRQSTNVYGRVLKTAANQATGVLV